MFLGIEYNKWHCILAVIGIVGLFLIGFLELFLPWYPSLERYGLSALVVALLYFGSVIFAVAVHASYESIQANDPEVVIIYGSWKTFQDNSRDDWRWFMRGVVISSAVIGVFLTVFLYII